MYHNSSQMWWNKGRSLTLSHFYNHTDLAKFFQKLQVSCLSVTTRSQHLSLGQRTCCAHAPLAVASSTEVQQGAAEASLLSLHLFNTVTHATQPALWFYALTPHFSFQFISSEPLMGSKRSYVQAIGRWATPPLAWRTFPSMLCRAELWLKFELAPLLRNSRDGFLQRAHDLVMHVCICEGCAAWATAF